MINWNKYVIIYKFTTQKGKFSASNDKYTQSVACWSNTVQDTSKEKVPLIPRKISFTPTTITICASKQKRKRKNAG